MLIQTAIAFLLKSAVCSGLMLGYYWLALRNKKLHQYNRFYLLSTVAISLIVPFLHFEWYSVTAHEVQPVFKLLQVSGVAAGEQDPVIKSSWLDYKHMIVAGLYALVTIILTALLMMKIAWVYRQKKRNAITVMNGFCFVHTQLSKAPFSFFNNLFWRDDIDIESPAGKQILQHELAHIKQKHSWDKLLLQVVSALCWLNPVYWIIQKELSLVHEFIADEQAITDKDTEAFAHMLLQTHYGTGFRDVVHPFFHSPIKRRLIMLHQLSKPKYNYLRRLMVLPLLAGSVMLFSFKVNTNGNVNKSNKRIIMALDAGHGGTDIGAVNSNGTVEKDLNLRITKHMMQLAEQHNIEIVPTHADDIDIPLMQRATIANNANASVMVSIHVNAPDVNSSKKQSGYQLILDERSTQAEQSKVFASAIAARLRNQDIQAKLMTKHLAVLKGLQMPAILIECGTMDNKKEMALLNDNEQLDRLCTNILNAVVDYQNHKVSGSDPHTEKEKTGWILKKDEGSYKYVAGKLVRTDNK